MSKLKIVDSFIEIWARPSYLISHRMLDCVQGIRKGGKDLRDIACLIQFLVIVVVPQESPQLLQCVTKLLPFLKSKSQPELSYYHCRITYRP